MNPGSRFWFWSWSGLPWGSRRCRCCCRPSGFRPGSSGLALLRRCRTCWSGASAAEPGPATQTGSEPEQKPVQLAVRNLQTLATSGASGPVSRKKDFLRSRKVPPHSASTAARSRSPAEPHTHQTTASDQNQEQNQRNLDPHALLTNIQTKPSLVLFRAAEQNRLLQQRPV